jgi:hypothetical protein
MKPSPGCILALCLYILIAAGCTSLPDAGPFVDASTQLRSGIASSGAVVESELRRMESPSGKAFADKLAKDWAARVALGDALVRYADSLQAITKAGGEGRESAQALADSATTLASAAGIALPGAAAVGVAVDSARFIYGQIALARAARSLEEALVLAAPAVDETAAIIANNLQLAEDVLVLASADLRRAARTNLQDKLGFREQWQRRRDALYSKQAGASELLRELEEANRLIATTREWYEPHERELAEIAKRLNAGRILIHATSEAVRQWAVAHRQLVGAIRDRRPVNSESLIEATRELRDLRRRIREL